MMTQSTKESTDSEPIIFEYAKYDTMKRRYETRYTIVYDDHAEFIVYIDGELDEQREHDFSDLDGSYLHGREWTIQTRDDVLDYFSEHHNYEQTDNPDHDFDLGGDYPDAL
ncbi:hypothetical protein [Halolamina salifodinae]|uniref:Uncharacterized protein n=1 Tax=Halolamina salifodinae TaxID=1202767 RepID=A0A8T4GZL2_9EURY|nr:hypothetical protein [Halolamina salifodinae]MBP1986984.1 hypothetical protein [Halolamina salifodinae]